MILAAVAAGTDEPVAREEAAIAEQLRRGKPITVRLKEWAFSGLTPPEKEVRAGDTGTPVG